MVDFLEKIKHLSPEVQSNIIAAYNSAVRYRDFLNAKGLQPSPSGLRSSSVVSFDKKSKQWQILEGRIIQKGKNVNLYR